MKAEAGSVRAALSAAAARLAVTSDTPRLDAELLMAHALGGTREAMLLAGLDRDAPPGFAALLERRAALEPVAYIVGRRDFWTIALDVGPGALVPRPDSETLLEAAVAHFGARAPARILDLGTGPGTLLLAALAQWPEARGVGLDRSPRALDYARANAERLGLASRAQFVEGDWDCAPDERFDLILCNPPYIAEGAALGAGVAEHEPAEALFAGPDGLAAYRRLAALIPPRIAPGGLAAIELGAGQLAAVAPLFDAAGFTLWSRPDLNGHDRCLLLAR